MTNEQHVQQESSPSSAIKQLLESEEITVINIGLSRFFETLDAEGVDVQHVNWRPPAGGDDNLDGMLDVLGRGE